MHVSAHISAEIKKHVWRQEAGNFSCLGGPQSEQLCN